MPTAVQVSEVVQEVLEIVPTALRVSLTVREVLRHPRKSPQVVSWRLRW